MLLYRDIEDFKWVLLYNQKFDILLNMMIIFLVMLWFNLLIEFIALLVIIKFYVSLRKMLSFVISSTHLHNLLLLISAVEIIVQSNTLLLCP